MKSVGKVVLVAFATMALLSGCASTGATSASAVSNVATAKSRIYQVEAKTATQRAVGKCVASVAFGAIAGAIIGQAAGKNARGGAAAGALLGAGACTVFLELAAEEDQERLRQMERDAVAGSSGETATFRTQTGATATVQTRVQDAPEVAEQASVRSGSDKQAVTACRYASQDVSVGGQSTSTPRQLWCRLETGDWAPLTQ